MHIYNLQPNSLMMVHLTSDLLLSKILELSHYKIRKRLVILFMLIHMYLSLPLPLLVSAFYLQSIVFFLRKTSRRYGCIECDPLVQKGLDKSVSRIVDYVFAVLLSDISCTFVMLGSEQYCYHYVSRPFKLSLRQSLYSPLTILLGFKQARHMVIPYLPMLIPPQNWTGYEIFSPIIRTYIVSVLLLLDPLYRFLLFWAFVLM